MGAGFTENLHFFTDKNYNCGNCREFDRVNLYNIVGADLAEKGKILLITAEIFSDTPKIFYYSPYEKELPCAVYLPELNSLIACSYNACPTERLRCRSFDIGRILDSARMTLAEEIVEYTMNQSHTYMTKSLNLIGVADLLLKEYTKTVTELIKKDKLKSYAVRKVSSLLERKEGKGSTAQKLVSAISCRGYRFSDDFSDYRIIRLCDEYISASSVFVKTASHTANRLGYDTIISKAVDSEHSPVHLLIPEAKTIFVSEQAAILGVRFPETQKINLERYYNRELLDSRRHSVDFYSEYIHRLYNEAALCARISTDIKNQGRKLLMPYISEKITGEIAAEIVSCILNNS